MTRLFVPMLLFQIFQRFILYEQATMLSCWGKRQYWEGDSRSFGSKWHAPRAYALS